MNSWTFWLENGLKWREWKENTACVQPEFHFRVLCNLWLKLHSDLLCIWLIRHIMLMHRDSIKICDIYSDNINNKLNCPLLLHYLVSSRSVIKSFLIIYYSCRRRTLWSISKSTTTICNARSAAADIRSDSYASDGENDFISLCCSDNTVE